MRLLFVLAVLTLPLQASHAAQKTLSYEVDGVTMESILVWDDSIDTPRPGLVMVPNWMGINDSQIAKAREIAGSDYVVLVADVYGRELRPSNASEAAAAAGSMYQDRPALRARAQAALEQLRGQADMAPVDASKVAAIGFCFGGSTVLELARSGSDVAAVVSFHGGLNSSMPASAQTLQSPILVLNGADDPMVSNEQIVAFEEEMRAADADWQFVNYGGAVHCFAESDAASPPNCVYHEASAKRAFSAMNRFIAEQFED